MSTQTGDRLGRPCERQSVTFFERHYTWRADKLLDAHGRVPSRAVADLIRRYRANSAAAAVLPGDSWCSFREMTGAGPLAVNFATNTHKTIAAIFGCDLAALDRAALRLDGRSEAGAGFDRRYRFPALPDVPLILNYNAADELFPAQAQLLFRRSAGNLLEPHDLFSLATYLTGRLAEQND